LEARRAAGVERLSGVLGNRFVRALQGVAMIMAVAGNGKRN
jgi:hypothetical protein